MALTVIDGGVSEAEARVVSIIREMLKSAEEDGGVEFVGYLKTRDGQYVISNSGGISRHKLAGILMDMALVSLNNIDGSL